MATPYWIALVAGLSVIAILALVLVVTGTHRLRTRKTLHTDPLDIADPLPLAAVDADAARAERRRERERSRVA